jgi:hypothetical protein
MMFLAVAERDVASPSAGVQVCSAVVKSLFEHQKAICGIGTSYGQSTIKHVTGNKLD